MSYQEYAVIFALMFSVAAAFCGQFHNDKIKLRKKCEKLSEENRKLRAALLGKEI